MIDAKQLATHLNEYRYDFGMTQPGVVARYTSLFSRLQFTDLAEDARVYLAAELITQCTPRVGSVATNGDSTLYLRMVAADISHWPSERGNAGRRLKHIAYALDTCSAGFLEPPGVLAATFLLHQLEFFFRMLAPHIDAGGAFVNAQMKREAELTLEKKISRDRISSIEAAYALAMCDQTSLAIKTLSRLDAELGPTSTYDRTLNTLGDRIGYMRHQVSHGYWADPSADGLFYGLMTAIVLYGTCLFEREPRLSRAAPNAGLD